MNGLSSQLGEIEALAAWVAVTRPVAEIVICPPATLIMRAAQIAEGRIGIGGQDCHLGISGACTADISAQMLKDAGACSVIIGHSERRQHHGETDAMVAAKASAGLRAGLQVILCVGETQAQRADGKALSVCGDQIAGSVPGGATSAATALAYEPLWAIGTGHMPSSGQIIEMHAHICHCLEVRLGEEGRQVRILYGGSVKPSNARAVLALPGVGGALIGGASLKAEDFEGILHTVSTIDAPKVEKLAYGNSLNRVGIASDHGGWLIHRLTYRRVNRNLHVRGYKEEGTITTAFDMRVQNDLDRFHLVQDVVDRVPHLGTQGSYLKQLMQDTHRAQAIHRPAWSGATRDQQLEVGSAAASVASSATVETSGLSGQELCHEV